MSPIKLDLNLGGDFEVKDLKFSFGKRIASGDLADFYECTLHRPVSHKANGNRFDHILEDDVDVTNAVLKVTRDPLDNDLAENEVKNLLKLFPMKAADEKFYRYLPQVLASFSAKVQGADRQALVIPFMTDYYNLEEVHKAHPVLDYRDVVWMFKRTLGGLGWAHHNGIIHGAILPPHVLVHPVAHGAKLLDWSYSAEKGSNVRAMSRPYEAFYAPEIPAKQEVRPSTDIFMAAKCALFLMGGDVKTNTFPTTVPGPIVEFFLDAMNLDRFMRPQDAWDLHEQFGNLLLKVVGKPCYRKLEMPAKDPK